MYINEEKHIVSSWCNLLLVVVFLHSVPQGITKMHIYSKIRRLFVPVVILMIFNLLTSSISTDTEQ